jgi:probable F420-dependent oxidoreductase
MKIKIGFGANTNAMGETPMNLARAGEDMGYESMWLGEHIFIPAERREGALWDLGVDLPEEYKHMFDPFLLHMAGAAVTKRLKFGASIVLVPQRHPLITAKEVATLDQLSNGRFIFGVGAGWLKEEADIMGYPFEKRWPITMEYVRAMKTLWTEEKPSFKGEYISFPPLYCYPKPVQKPYPPILIGAGNPNSKAMPAILKRIAEHSDGWLPSFFTPQQLAPHMKRLKELCQEHGRDFSKIDTTLLVAAYTLSVGEKFKSMEGMDVPPMNPQELIAQYEEIGVTRILVGLDFLTKQNGLKMLEKAAKGLQLF